MRTAALFVVLAALCVAVSANFAGYKVVRANLANNQLVALVQSWDLDVWSHESVLSVGLNDIRVNEYHLRSLAKLQVEYTVLIDDVEKHMVDGQRDLEESRAQSTLADFFTAYHTYAEFGTYLTNLTNTYSTISKFIPSVGVSIQGRNLYGVTITGTATGTKKQIFVSAGQHAREWVAPATALYIIEQLVTKYATDAAVKTLLDKTIFHFVPTSNPDGYFWTWAGSANRLWRKNRRANTGGSFGVDLNRNWNDHWGGEGSSGTPTSDTYRGTAAFSEPESKAISDYINKNGPFVGAIDYHSYGQLILRPYGWTTAAPPNEALAKSVGDTIRARILAVNNVPYTSQASWQLYYTTGSAQDWYYSQAKIPLSFTIELRDTGSYGFQLPANQIKATGNENWAGFLYFAQTAIA